MVVWWSNLKWCTVSLEIVRCAFRPAIHNNCAISSKFEFAWKQYFIKWWINYLYNCTLNPRYTTFLWQPKRLNKLLIIPSKKMLYARFFFIVHGLNPPTYNISECLQLNLYYILLSSYLWVLSVLDSFVIWKRLVIGWMWTCHFVIFVQNLRIMFFNRGE